MAVAEVKARVRRGEYVTDAGKVAEAMLSRAPWLLGV